jgi:hypothetical protein
MLGEAWPLGLLLFALVDNRKALARWVRARIRA